MTRTNKTPSESLELNRLLMMQPADNEKLATTSQTDVISAALTGLLALGVAGWLVARHTAYDRFALPMLWAASTCYLLIAIAGGALHSLFGRLIFLALFFCWLGDCIGPGNFVPGLVCFVFAHLAFIPAFCTHGLQTRRFLASLVIALLFGGIAFAWLYPHVPPEEYLTIFTYMLIITAMVVFAGGTRPGPRARLIVIAAIAFYVSDLFLARSRFVAKDFINTLIGYPLYYAACVLFAFCIRYPGGDRGT